MSDVGQINQALHRLFHEENQRIVFWNDPDQEFAAALPQVMVEGVTEQSAQIRGVDLTRKELSLFGSRNNSHQFQTAIDYY